MAIEFWNIDLSIKYDDFKVIIPIVGGLIGFIIYWFTRQSEKIKEKFIDRFGADNGMVKFIVYTRYLGGMTIGLIPVVIYFIVFPETTLAQIGLGFYYETIFTILMWTIILSAILIPLVSFSARKPKNLANFPQIRVEEWTRKTMGLNLFSWIIYLLGYEIMFRGLLLFPLVKEIGLWPAIAVNIGIYSSTHILKGLDEAIGAIPLSIVFCLLSVYSGSIWIAFLAHIAIAWTNSIMALKHHPDMHFLRE